MFLDRAIIYAKKLNWQQKIIIPIVIAGVLVGLLYRWSIGYQYEYLSNLITARHILCNKIKAAHHTWIELNGYNKALQQTQNLIAFHSLGCHLALDNLSIVQQIMLLIEQSGLISKTINPIENKISDKNNLAVLYVECYGSYATLQTFLQKILKFPIAIIISKCQIQKNSNGSSDANLLIQLTLIITNWNNKPCHF